MDSEEAAIVRGIVRSVLTADDASKLASKVYREAGEAVRRADEEYNCAMKALGDVLDGRKIIVDNAMIWVSSGNLWYFPFSNCENADQPVSGEQK